MLCYIPGEAAGECGFDLQPFGSCHVLVAPAFSPSLSRLFVSCLSIHIQAAIAPLTLIVWELVASGSSRCDYLSSPKDLANLFAKQ